MAVWDMDRAPDARTQEAYLRNRADLLSKILINHVVWAHSLERFPVEASLAARWTDVDGREQVAVINALWLQAHRHVVRSLVADLLDCGLPGQRLLQDVMTEHVDGETSRDRPVS